MAIAELPLTEVRGTYKLTETGQRYLRARLEEAGKTVTSLALELGISRKHLSNVLNGRVPLMEPLIDRLCRAVDADATITRVFRDRDRVVGGPSAYGAMRGSMVVLCDPTEPMTDWEMLED